MKDGGHSKPPPIFCKKFIIILMFFYSVIYILQTFDKKQPLTLQQHQIDPDDNKVPF